LEKNTFSFGINTIKITLKNIRTFEEFIGDLETKNIRKLAVDQETDDGDELYVDPNTNGSGDEGDDDFAED